MGDWNSHHPSWGSAASDFRGRSLHAWVSATGLTLLNDGSPTRVGAAGQRDTAIDLALAPARWGLRATWEVLEDSLGSDHLPCLVRLLLDDAPTPVQHRTTRRWVTKDPEGWVLFQDYLVTHGHDVLVLPPSVDAYTALLDLLYRAMDASFPRRHLTAARHPRHRAREWWTPDCSAAVAIRREALRDLRRHHTDRTYARWADADDVVKRVTTAAKKAHWRDFVESLSPPVNMRQLWAMARRAAGAPAPAPSSGEWLDDFLGIYAPDTAPTGPRPVFNDADGPDPHGLGADFTLTELQVALRGMRDTAPGLDGVSALMLRRAPIQLQEYLLRLYNVFWHTAEHPPAWRENLLLPLPKPGKPPDLAASYRPIALAPVPYKLWEHMLKSRTEWWAESLGLLDPSQHGFRKGRSTADAIGQLVSHAYAGMSRGDFTIVFFADVASAYNSVLPEQFLAKLAACGAHPRLLNNIAAMLYGQHLYATYQGRLVGPRVTDIGFAQGWVSSPLWYILDKKDLCRDLPNGVEATQFADDVAIFLTAPSLSAGLRRLRPAIEEFVCRLRSAGAGLSPGKSSWTVLTYRRLARPLPPLLLHGEAVPHLDHTKYLGVWISPQLSWARHIAEMAAKCDRRINFMRSLAGATWGCHPGMLLRLYQTTVRPVLEYGAGLVSPRTAYHWNKLQRIASAALRVALGALPSTSIPALLVEAGEWPIRTRLEYLADRLLIRWRSAPHDRLYPRLQVLARHRRFQARPPLLLQRAAALPPAPPQPPPAFHTWPCYSLHHAAWMLPLPVTLFYPPAPVTAPGGEADTTPNGIFNILLRSLWRDTLVVATDGSRASAGPAATVGAAYVLPGQPGGAMFRLPDQATVFLAEAYAILQALQHGRHSPARRIAVVSDSQSVLSAVCSHTPTATTPAVVVDIRRAVRDLLADGRWASLHWVPAHVGIQANEDADVAANAARDLAAVRLLALPPGVFYAAQRDAHAVAWAAFWASSPKGRHLHALTPVPSRRAWFRSLNAPRKGITATIRLRVGHARTPAHLHKVAGRQYPDCQCGAAEADAAHLLIACPFVDRAAFWDALQGLDKRFDATSATLPQLLQRPVLLAQALPALLRANHTLTL
ncbi:putative RNA-directed DNA polymerase from transposon X-element [Frankliniella fusca]|uniref:RNA-directed DNA polymerase from transposon X-element n=1 Tax=Frankliniella fusca TaxID=407009 RepID=A0AAE1I2R6_9NEOP|nr:putative RNA-directed DNA polymerase from transposon X-element [Frankliniella fusca]